MVRGRSRGGRLGVEPGVFRTVSASLRETLTAGLGVPEKGEPRRAWTVTLLPKTDQRMRKNYCIHAVGVESSIGTAPPGFGVSSRRGGPERGGRAAAIELGSIGRVGICYRGMGCYGKVGRGSRRFRVKSWRY